MRYRDALIPGFFLLAVCSCVEVSNKKAAETDSSSQSCMSVPMRFGDTSLTRVTASGDTSTKGMVLISGGTFDMGADNSQASSDEFPKHRVTISSFFMDATEVTNAQFAEFVEATGYVTTAEQSPDWEELKKTLPEGTPKPHDSLLVPASLVFVQTAGPVNLHNYSTWWKWQRGADWRHPEGPGSTIKGKENFPVIHISWIDANAYCQWAGKRLPTEAEWEYAARGGLQNHIYPWGNEHVNRGRPKANSWEGEFPYRNEKKDGFIKLAPVRSFEPNGFGLYDMAGNVWEWCSDWYHADYYKTLQGKTSLNPKGPATSFDPQDPAMPKRAVRGGSFLCNDSYCSGYRVARRMKSTPDTGLEHTGFRCVKDVQ